MNGQIELVFENVSTEAVDRLINEVLQEAKIMEIFHSELGHFDPNLNYGNISVCLQKKEGACTIFVKASVAVIGQVRIRNPLITVLLFENLIDVSVIFSDIDFIDIDRNYVVQNLAIGSKYLAGKAKNDNYYCGFEPAMDKATRLFTKDIIGPISEL